MTTRFFNTAGPCRPELHYMLPADARVPAVLVSMESGPAFPDDIGAREVLTARKSSRLDTVAEQRRDPRLRPEIASVRAGQVLAGVPASDRQLAADLSLVWRGAEGGMEIANPIYREVLR